MTAPPAQGSLPHHGLEVFHVARELLIAVRDANVRDAKLRDEATRAAKGACLNIAEGAARSTRLDKARAYTIARGEAAEAAAAVEIAVVLGAASPESEAKVVALASRVVAMLTRLIR
jgi:four helix bundle protein